MQDEFGQDDYHYDPHGIGEAPTDTPCEEPPISARELAEIRDILDNNQSR